MYLAPFAMSVHASWLLNTRGVHTWALYRSCKQSSARISHGTTSVISPKAIGSMESFVRRAWTHRIWWQICVHHVVPHFGYVTTKTSVGLARKARPFSTDSTLCIMALRSRMRLSGLIALSGEGLIASSSLVLESLAASRMGASSEATSESEESASFCLMTPLQSGKSSSESLIVRAL